MFSLQLIYFTLLINLLTNIKIFVFFSCVSMRSCYARLRTLNCNSYLYILSHFIRLLLYCMGIFSGLITLYCPFSPFSANYIATKHSERVSLILISNIISGVVLIGHVKCQVNCSCIMYSRRIVLSSIYHCGYNMVQ